MFVDRALVERADHALHDVVLAAAVLVGLGGGRQVLRVLAREARVGRVRGDTGVAMAAGAGARGLLAGRGVAGSLGSRARRLLQRVEQREVGDVAIADARGERRHEVVLALAGLVVLHGRGEVFRVEADEARRAGRRADPRVAVAAAAAGRRRLARLQRILRRLLRRRGRALAAGAGRAGSRLP